jgi:hypothetical protein
MTTDANEVIALRSSSDLLLLELEGKLKVEWKKSEEGTAEQRENMISWLYAEFSEIVGAQNQIREPPEQEYLRVKEQLEKMAREGVNT